MTSASFDSVTVEISDDLTSGSSEEAEVIIHEGGHMESIASDLTGHLRDTATDAVTGRKGKILDHDSRPGEKKAIKYRDQVCGSNQSCNSGPGPN